MESDHKDMTYDALFHSKPSKAVFHDLSEEADQ